MSNKVYVELDALLDTRLAVMNSIDPQAAVAMVRAEEYYTRLSDDFSKLTGVAHETYQAAWESRDEEALRHSIKTHMPLMLSELMNRLEVQEENAPYAEELALEVNIWPYKNLSDAERDTLQLAVLAHAGIQTIPTIVCMNPKDLTPRKIKAEYSGLIMYNLRDWLQHHVEAFTRCGCPAVAVLAPALFNGEIVEAKDLTTDPELRTDFSVFSLTELACVEFFQLNYLDVKYFSIWR